MSLTMENPPDLIVVVPSDDQHQEKKKLLIETIADKDKQSHEDVIQELRSEKQALQNQIEQLRLELALRKTYDEFHDQSHLLQQRFHQQIQSVITDQTELIQQIAAHVSTYIGDVLRKSIESIESLRLLHQKELSASPQNLPTCIQQQSSEMTELCHHLIQEQHSIPEPFVHTLIDHCQTSLTDLKSSFNSKLSYLNDIHASTVEHLKNKHDQEIAELQCELSLVSQYRH